MSSLSNAGPQVKLHLQGQALRFSVSGLSTPAGNHAPRGSVKTFSRRSRKRMLETVSRLEYGQQEGRFRWSFVGLTYHEAPGDPRSCKAHLKAFYKRLVRDYGEVGFVWRVEAQTRGVPHFHLLLWGPYIPWQRLTAHWEAVIGQKGSTDIALIYSWKQCLSYVSKYMAKVGQERDPSPAPQSAGCEAAAQGAGAVAVVDLINEPYWARVGRRWGVMGRANLPWAQVVELVQRLAGKGFWKFRRAAARFYRGLSRKYRGGGLIFTQDSYNWLRLWGECVGWGVDVGDSSE